MRTLGERGEGALYFPSVAGVSTICGGVSRYLIRISVRLEEVADLWQRLDTALKLPRQP
jgi:hypothetical protein